ncbi:M56 family metallopeptidase [Schlesneria sp. DSM 10557]|uniref:M56 family metallopeptidase n=1 Tax=Schlesneria sp. DSM 10557 TaxID=3044399 RepID=UPI0035A0BAE1
MTILVAWFTGTWAQSLCWALLHSLWQGAVWSALLAVCLTMISRNRPQLRYAASLSCLAGLAVGVLVTGSFLRLPSDLIPFFSSPSNVTANSLQEPTGTGSSLPVTSSPSMPGASKVLPSSDRPFVPMESRLIWGIPSRLNRVVRQFSPFLLWGWLFGVALNFLQCVRQRTAAETWKLGEPVRDAVALDIFLRLKAQLRIHRPVKLIASLHAHSPCVIGTFSPVILIPMSLATGLSPDQWKAILGHELAHLRRWDDVVNLGQQVIESLLFFNPAVWWISRQIRAEREACCDVWGARLTASSLNYAQVLLDIAEKITTPPPAVVLGFADERSGSLLDRVRRLVERNAVAPTRFTWKSILLVLVVAVTAVALLQYGSDLAVFSAARLLSDGERVSELAKVADEINPAANITEQRLIISGKVHTSDGQPLPNLIWVYSQTQKGNSGTGMTQGDIKGGESNEFRVDVPPGETWLQFMGDGYATTMVGPYLSGRVDEIKDVEVVLKPGVPVTLQLRDDADRPIPDAEVIVSAWERNQGFGLFKPRQTDSSGEVVIPHVQPDRRHSLSVTAPGFQRLDVRPAVLNPDAPLTLQMTRAQPATGQVLASDGLPLAGATLRRLRVRRLQLVDNTGMSQPPLATTDERGEFTLDQLLDGSIYDLLVEHPDYAPAILTNVQPGTRDRVIQLQPGVTVSGIVRGTPQQLEELQKKHVGVRFSQSKNGAFDGENLSFNRPFKLEFAEGEAHFQIDHVPAGDLQFSLGDQQIHKKVSGPVHDLVLTLNEPARPFQREVSLVFRKQGEVVAPEGRLQLSIRDQNPGSANPYDISMARLTNGHCVVQVPAPCEIRIQLNQLIGFTLTDEEFVARIPAGNDLFTVDVPVEPAGGVNGVVLNSDGTPASGINVVLEAVSSRWTLSMNREKRQLLNAHSNSSGQFFLGPVPFGSRCGLRASRDKFIILGPQFTLSEKQPLPQFKLEFNLPVKATVRVLDPLGNRLQGIPVMIRCEHPRVTTSWGTAETTNAQGELTVPQINPEMVSSYRAIVRPNKDYQNAVVTLQGDSTVDVKLQPGLFLSGTLVNKAGRPLSGRIVTAGAGPYFGIDRNRYSAESPTDDEGHFRFSNLPAEEVRIELEYGSVAGAVRKFHPTTEDQMKPITIESAY